jgi:hypothetical protein
LRDCSPDRRIQTNDSGMGPRATSSLLYDGAGGGACRRCGAEEHRFGRLPPAYVHLLGLYLGDGSISEHRRQVYRLRVTLDVRYRGIVRECEAAMRSVVPRNRVSRQLRKCNCYEVHAYSKGWPCLFPQHGPGKKHDRPIFLAAWQRELAERWPKHLLRGLIQGRVPLSG